MLHVAALGNNGDWDAEEEPLDSGVFLHMSVLFERPFRPTFRRLCFVSSRPFGHGGLELITLRATDEYLTVWEM